MTKNPIEAFQIKRRPALFHVLRLQSLGGNLSQTHSSLLWGKMKRNLEERCFQKLFFLVLPSMRPYCRFLKFFKILTNSSSPDQLSPGKGGEMTIPGHLSSLRYFLHFVKLMSTALGQQ